MSDQQPPRFQTHDYDDTQGYPAGPAPVPLAIRHGDHYDVLQGGHLHHLRQDGALEEHTVPISETNPADCTEGRFTPFGGLGHDASHRHGEGCGHPLVPHGGHMDFLVDGRLHHPHDGHCDDHGPVQIED